MDAALVTKLLDAAYLLALAAWSGALFFLVAAVLPLVRSELDPAAGRRLSQKLTSIAALWGATCGAIALPASLGAPLSFPELRSRGVGLQAAVILIAIGLMFHCAQVPRRGVGKPGGPVSGDGDHPRGPGRIMGLALMLLIGLLIAFALRPRPMTGGIVEPTPLERARSELERAGGLGAARAESRELAPASVLAKPDRDGVDCQ